MPCRVMDEQVNARFNAKMLGIIDKAIEMGVANDRSEFIRMAVAAKLEKLSLFKPRD